MPRQPSLYEWYTYINNRFEFSGVKVILGLFTGNNNYFDNQSRFIDPEHNVGLQAGVEYELVDNTLYLQADYMTGKTALSNLIVGGAYKVTKQTILSAGYQVPNYSVTSSKGLVVELTFVQ